MFEELCRKHGVIRTPAGKYNETGDREMEDHPVSYFAMETSYRDRDGAIQSETNFYCKNFEEPVPPNSIFLADDGTEYSIETAKFIFNHFDNAFEFNKLTVRAWRSR